jgi:DNA repair ATPase RecN
MADRQLNVTKHEQNHRTVAEVSELTFDERVLAIAQMMAGLRVNQATLDTAKTLLLEQD